MAIPLTRIIPNSGEALPAIGLGTWRTFDVGDRLSHLGAAAAEVRGVPSSGDVCHSRDASAEHMRDNMAAASGALPDAVMRSRIAAAAD